MKPPSTKLPSLVVKVPRTTEDSGLEVGKSVADLPVAPGEHKKVFHTEDKWTDVSSGG